MVEWLKRWNRHQQGLGSKSTRAILVFEKDTLWLFTLIGCLGKQFLIKVISLLKFQADSNILASPEA